MRAALNMASTTALMRSMTTAFGIILTCADILFHSSSDASR
jgi:hypothetical protein